MKVHLQSRFAKDIGKTYAATILALMLTHVVVFFSLCMGFESNFKCVRNMHNKFPLLKIHFRFLCLHRCFYSSTCRLRKYLSTPPLSRQKPRGFEFCPFMTGRIDVSMTTVALDNKGCWKGCRNSIASTPCRNSCYYYQWTPQTINFFITWRIISLCLDRQFCYIK